MKCSMTGQEKGDLLIQVTTWAGLTVFVILKIDHSILEITKLFSIFACFPCNNFQTFKRKKKKNSQRYFKSEFLSLLYFLLSIGSVMVSVLATSAVDRGVSPGWVKQDYKIGICCWYLSLLH